MGALTVSTEQKATRRRALGRRLAQKASQLSTMVQELNGSPDLQFLTASETKAVEKQLSGLAAVGTNMTKIGAKLEEK